MMTIGRNQMELGWRQAHWEEKSKYVTRNVCEEASFKILCSLELRWSIAELTLFQ